MINNFSAILLKSTIFTAFLLSSICNWGQVRLPKLISDGMVLQRGEDIKIWGWASANEEVVIEFEGQIYNTKANIEGKWSLNLPPKEKGGPYTMTFKASNAIILEDIYFGDVWVCSGQSNMELSMKRVKEKYREVIKRKQNPMIRQFLVPDDYDFKKKHSDFSEGRWIPLDSESIMDFTAVGYFFANKIYEDIDVPIGLINVALGGSPVEAWMSEQALQEFPEAWKEMQKFKNDTLISDIENGDRKRIQGWYKELDEKDKGLQDGQPVWTATHAEDDSWENFNIPGNWNQLPGGDIDGSVWFKKKVNIPIAMTGKPASLWLGRIVDQDFAYINDTLVGTTGYQYPPRRYYFGPDILKGGMNDITVRVVNSSGLGEFVSDKPYFIATDKDTLHLNGTWKYKIGTKMPPLGSQTFVRWKPGGLYNKMIHPLLNYKIKGILWYQGESNTGTPEGYHKALSSMIHQWRKDWGYDRLPFLFVQLANFMEARPEPVDSKWAELRNEQLKTLEVANTGMAVAIDLGDWNDVHPEDKKSVGDRLALLALDKVYNKKEIVSQSPVPSDINFLNGKVTISFKHDDVGLMLTSGSKVNNLAISADGKSFIWANSHLKGNTLSVWHDDIPVPVAVRYAWADNPVNVNFYSYSGLPVSPFEVRK